VTAGAYLVGERNNGAEMLHLEPGSRGWVTNAHDTKRMLDKKHGGDLYLTVNGIAPPANVTRWAVEVHHRLRLAQSLVDL
jgi:hypothetical protein